ncbi:MAG: hypothetical protein GC165_04090 [Armatimonadetes bacterium]|nr:hypothetical protein [Armatimonadota bacterium]
MTIVSLYLLQPSQNSQSEDFSKPIAVLAGRPMGIANWDVFRKGLLSEMNAAGADRHSNPYVSSGGGLFFMNQSEVNLYVDHTYVPLAILRAKESFLSLFEGDGIRGVHAFSKFSTLLYDGLHDEIVRKYPSYGLPKDFVVSFTIIPQIEAIFREGDVTVDLLSTAPEPQTRAALADSPLYKEGTDRAISNRLRDQTLQSIPETKFFIEGPHHGRLISSLFMASMKRFDEWRFGQAAKDDARMWNAATKMNGFSDIVKVCSCQTFAQLQAASPEEANHLYQILQKDYLLLGLHAPDEVNTYLPSARLEGTFRIKAFFALPDGTIGSVDYPT